MSLLFADIYEAIRCLRTQKGVCEKDILKYVQERVGGCMKVGNVLKTIRTLKKLVEDGVLLKKGKRYVFSPNPPDQNEEEEEEEEEDEDENKEELDMEDDECDEEGEDNEEEEDDDDDDEEYDEEDDDDDDDDDEECEEKDINVDTSTNPVSKENQQPIPENLTNSLSKDKFASNPNKKNGDASGKVNNDNESGIKCVKSTDNRNGKKSARMASKAKDVTQGNEDMKSKGGEEKIGKVLQKHKRKCRTKRSNPLHCSCRSRSPIKKIKADLFHCLKRERSDQLWAISSQSLQELMDSDMDVDLDREREVRSLECGAFQHQSPEGSPPPNTAGMKLIRRESLSNARDTKKTEPSFEGDNEYYLKENYENKLHQTESDRNWCSNMEGDKGQQKYKRGLPVDDDRNVNVEKKTSLCSVCEKKKK